MDVPGGLAEGKSGGEEGKALHFNKRFSPSFLGSFPQKRKLKWLDLLIEAGIPAAPINTIPEALSDPHVSARQMVQTVHHPTAGPLRLLGPAAKFSSTPARIRLPPLLGQHTEEVLRDLLGYSAEEIARLREEGIV